MSNTKLKYILSSSQIRNLISKINSRDIIYKDIPAEHKHNISIILAAVKISMNNIKLLPARCYDDYDVMIELVRYNGLLLAYASDDLKQNYNIVLTAVSQNGMAIRIIYEYETVFEEDYTYINGHDPCRFYEPRKIIDDTWQNLVDNEEIVSTAVAQNAYAFEYISGRLQQNVEIAKLAINQNDRRHAHMESPERCDKEIILDAFINTKQSLSNVPYELKTKITNIMKNAIRGDMTFFYKKIIDGTLYPCARLWVKLLTFEKYEELVFWVESNISKYKSLFEVLFYKCKNFNSHVRIGYIDPVRDILLSYLAPQYKNKSILDDILCSMY